MDGNAEEREKAIAFDLEQTLEGVGLLCMVTVVSNAFIGLEVTEATGLNVIFVLDNLKDLTADSTIQILLHAKVDAVIVPVTLDQQSLFDKISLTITAIMQGNTPANPVFTSLPWETADTANNEPKRRRHQDRHCVISYKAEPAVRPKQLMLGNVVSAAILQATPEAPIGGTIRVFEHNSPMGKRFDARTTSSPYLEDFLENGSFSNDMLGMFELFPDDTDPFLFQPIDGFTLPA